MPLLLELQLASWLERAADEMRRRRQLDVGDLGPTRGLRGRGGGSAAAHLHHHCHQHGHRDNDERHGVDRRRDALADLVGDEDGEGLLGTDREVGGGEVLERLQEGECRRREHGRAQIGQRDPPEHLARRGAEIEAGFLERRVEPLQPGDEDQHAIGGDEAALRERRGPPVRPEPEPLAPEDERRDAEHDARAPGSARPERRRAGSSRAAARAPA